MNVTGVIPQIRTTDLDSAIDFYVATLGFELDFRHEDFYAGVRIANQRIHLKLVDAPDSSIQSVVDGGHLHLYFPTDDVDADAQRLKHRGVAFVREVADTPWGTREFYVTDNDGHILCFAQSVAT